jgi:hypothetical protein
MGTQPVLANSWYAGNIRTGAYGVSAYIDTPDSAPYVVGDGISSWVSTSGDNNDWV